ncbi:hypothetical protein D3C87_1410920 [compost metagenome]
MSPFLAAILKFPSKSVCVLALVPFRIILTPGIGTRFLSVTLPEMYPSCALTICTNSINMSHKKCFALIFIFQMFWISFPKCLKYMLNNMRLLTLNITFLFVFVLFVTIECVLRYIFKNIANKLFNIKSIND